MKKRKNSILTNIVLIGMLLAGVFLLLYPSVSNFWNQRFQSRVIENYGERVAKMDEHQYTELWESAIAYNQRLSERKPQSLKLTDENRAEYNRELSLTEEGLMGYIEIPKISCSLPIYHGTEEKILQSSVGHLEWSSLPTGGENTHAVFSGHRGLPSAKLFTDLDQLVAGDTFVLQILDERLTYEVDQITIIYPTETTGLMIEEGKDLCTLITCTPYGVNTHRLLVRGHRVATAEREISIRVAADAIRIAPLMVSILIAIPFVLLLIMVLLLDDRITKRNKNS